MYSMKVLIPEPFNRLDGGRVLIALLGNSKRLADTCVGKSTPHLSGAGHQLIGHT